MDSKYHIVHVGHGLQAAEGWDGIQSSNRNQLWSWVGGSGWGEAALPWKGEQNGEVIWGSLAFSLGKWGTFVIHIGSGLGKRDQFHLGLNGKWSHEVTGWWSCTWGTVHCIKVYHSVPSTIGSLDPDKNSNLREVYMTGKRSTETKSVSKYKIIGR